MSIFQSNDPLHTVLYVQMDKETLCAKMAYFSDGEGGIPSELEVNAKGTFSVTLTAIYGVLFISL